MSAITFRYANFNKVKHRVMELLNISTTTYGTFDSDPFYKDPDIDAAIIEADIAVLTVILSTTGHPARTRYMFGQTLPTSPAGVELLFDYNPLGEIGPVDIFYKGAFRAAKPAPRDKIALWLLDKPADGTESVFTPADENELTSGYYAIENGLIYTTAKSSDNGGKPITVYYAGITAKGNRNTKTNANATISGHTITLGAGNTFDVSTDTHSDIVLVAFNPDSTNFITRIDTVTDSTHAVLLADYLPGTVPGGNFTINWGANISCPENYEDVITAKVVADLSAKQGVWAAASQYYSAVYGNYIKMIMAGADVVNKLERYEQQR